MTSTAERPHAPAVSSRPPRARARPPSALRLDAAPSLPRPIWGASFLLIAEGLESLAPGTIALGRSCSAGSPSPPFRTARGAGSSPRTGPRVALVGLLWMALPMTIFPIAEQWISSSVTGMLNGSMPLFAAAVAAIMLRRPPGRLQQAGILVGFLGVVAISLPSLQGGSRTALGARARGGGDGLLRHRDQRRRAAATALRRAPRHLAGPDGRHRPHRAVRAGRARRHRRSRGGRSPPWSCSAPSAPASPSSPRGR